MINPRYYPGDPNPHFEQCRCERCLAGEAAGIAPLSFFLYYVKFVAPSSGYGVTNPYQSVLIGNAGKMVVDGNTVREAIWRMSVQYHEYGLYKHRILAGHLGIRFLISMYEPYYSSSAANDGSDVVGSFMDIPICRTEKIDGIVLLPEQISNDNFGRMLNVGAKHGDGWVQFHGFIPYTKSHLVQCADDESWVWQRDSIEIVKLKQLIYANNGAHKGLEGKCAAKHRHYVLFGKDDHGTT